MSGERKTNDKRIAWWYNIQARPLAGAWCDFILGEKR